MATPDHAGLACGFYWTEGVRGLGWAVDAIPTMKGGSTIGIPSPPAIWLPDGRFVLPDIRDAERLQGFPAGWTASAVEDPERRNGPRWRLVGNAVSVPVAKWLGERLGEPREWDPESVEERQLDPAASWPTAAWGDAEGTRAVEVSAWPRQPDGPLDLEDFLKHPKRPLSARATRGFLRRTERAKLRFPEGLIAALRIHLDAVEEELLAA
jgi:DNA (cytosine-5)-methyltransferase 1